MLKLFFERGPLPHFHGFFKNYVKHIEVDTTDDCDYVISAQINIGEYNAKTIQNAINIYIKCKSKVIIFLVSDTSKKFRVPKNVLLFRTSLLKTRKKNNEFVLPYIFEPPLVYNQINKTVTPKIGFCGQTKNNIGKRKTCIKVFEKSGKFITNFIERSGFWNGKPNDEILKTEFEENIYNNHFNIANRGRGNFSIRFYQILSAGRIPVLLDTNILLPFSNEINYNEHIVISKSSRKLVLKTLNFYYSKTDIELRDVQSNNVQLYKNYFTLEGYGKKIEIILLDYVFIKPRIYDYFIFNKRI